MKKLSLLFVAVALSTHAAQIQFALSPAGTDNAVGLSPLNEVPAVTNSTGSGNTISGGIVFNTDTSILHVEVGYGSAAGFSDLTSPAQAMHIHASAPVGSNAPVLINLFPYHISTNPAAGGFIIGDIPFPSNSVPDLLAGLTYLNIHTPTNAGGEIRGQLIALAAPTNVAPSVTCAASATVECGTVSIVTIAVSDADNDALTVTWSLNGTAVQTNMLGAGITSNSTAVSYSSKFALGTNVVSITVADSVGNSVSCATTITVVDTTPPVIVSIQATPNTIWPPNHKMVNVRVQAEVTDTCSSTTWKVKSVTSNEAVDGNGNGNGNGNGKGKAKGKAKNSPDWKITGDHTLQVRAERAGGGNGRIYTITIEAADSSANTSLGTVTVTVPHDRGNHGDDDEDHGNQDNGHSNKKVKKN
jgi:hypothetical protein